MNREQAPHFIERKIRERLSGRYKTPLEKRKLEIKDGVPAEFDLSPKTRRSLGRSNRQGQGQLEN